MKASMVSALALILAGPPLHAQAGPARATGAVVTILGYNGTDSISGSGFIVSSDGIIVTAAHVLEGLSQAQVRLSSGETLAIEGVLDFDPRLDLAIVRIAGFNLPVVALGNSDSLTIGQRLFAIGSPLGLERTVTDGVLSGNRIEQGVKLLQVSVPISHGSSGGPVLVETGLVVGVAVMAIRNDLAQNINFAVPINYVRGKLALVGSKPLQTLSAIANQPVRDQSNVSALTTPATVNSNLDLNLAALGGAIMSDRQRDAAGFRHSSFVRYEITQDPTGRQVLERFFEDTIVRYFNPYNTPKVAVDHMRTTIWIDSMSQWEETYEREPLTAEARHEIRTMAFKNGALQTSNGNRTGLPAGIIPESSLWAFIAGLPDSLPAEVFIYTVNRETLTPVLNRIQFGRPNAGNVRIGTKEPFCGVVGRNVRQLRMSLTTATVSVGARRETTTVMTRQPHLRVDQTDDGCIYHPVL